MLNHFFIFKRLLDYDIRFVCWLEMKFWNWFGISFWNSSVCCTWPFCSFVPGFYVCREIFETYNFTDIFNGNSHKFPITIMIIMSRLSIVTVDSCLQRYKIAEWEAEIPKFINFLFRKLYKRAPYQNKMNISLNYHLLQ